MKSLTCCCLICHKEVTVRGFHSHYLTAHTEMGRENIKKAAIAANKKAQEIHNRKFNNRIESYGENPSICKQCGKKLIYKNRNNKFCNRSCSATYNNKTRTSTSTSTSKIPKTSKTPTTSYCKHCGIIIETKGRTTCDSCLAHIRIEAGKKLSSNPNFIEICRKGGKKSALKTIRRSKNEIELFDMCRNHFSSVRNNEPIVNGWDADIIIDEHKIAILWNGPWHYKEMGLSNHSLKQVQNRDRIKVKELTNAGWMVIIYEDRYYTPSSAFNNLLNVVLGVRIELT